MTITRCPEAGLSADYGDITVTDVARTMDFTVTLDGETVLRETYAPDDSGTVYIRDIAPLADMYRPAFALRPDADAGTGCVSLGLEFAEGAQTLQKTITVYACDAETAGTLTVDDLIMTPLTRCFEKTVCPGQKEYVSFYESEPGPVTAVVAYAGTDRDMSSKIVLADFSESSPVSSGIIRRLDVSPETVAELAGIDPARMVSYILYKKSKYSLKYTVNPYLHRRETFVFINSFGATETFTCTGRPESERKWAREYGQINRMRRTVKRELTLKHTAYTGYITAEQCQTAEDMLNAREICLIDEYGWHPVVIEEETFKTTSRPDEPTGVEFKYRLASQNGLQYRFKPRKYRIFDFTHDETYE